MVAAKITYDQAAGPNVVGTVLANSVIPSLIDVSTDAIRISGDEVEREKMIQMVDVGESSFVSLGCKRSRAK